MNERTKASIGLVLLGLVLILHFPLHRGRFLSPFETADTTLGYPYPAVIPYAFGAIMLAWGIGVYYARVPDALDI